jgi:putative flippase GtrA
MRSLSRWFLAPVESTLLQVPRALVASVFAALVDMSVLVILVEFFGLHKAPAAMIAYLPGTVLQYFLCRYWVFPATNDPNGGFAVFTLFAFVGLGITWAVMATLSDMAGLPYIFAKMVALGLAFSWNFLSRKWLLFRSTSRSSFEIDLADTSPTIIQM